MKNKRSKLWLSALILSAVLTLVICAVMNLWLIPAIEKNAGGLRVLDMRFYYSEADLSAFLSGLNSAGRDIYLHRQLPLDFFYPVAYAVFFSLALTGLSGGLMKRPKALIALPAALALFDYAENLCTLRFLTAGAAAPWAAVAPVCTLVKTVLMYACFLLLAVLAVWRLTRSKKAKGLEKTGDL